MIEEFHLILCSQHHPLETGRERSESSLHQYGVSDAILLKPVQERSWCLSNLRLLHHDDTLEVGMDPTRPQVGSNRNIGVVSRPLLGVVNTTEPLVEEVIEALMDFICLTHDHRVTLNGRVANGCYCINLCVDERHTVLELRHSAKQHAQCRHSFMTNELHSTYCIHMYRLYAMKSTV